METLFMTFCFDLELEILAPEPYQNLRIVEDLDRQCNFSQHH